MGNDPILSLSQSEVLNLYTMVTVINWSVRQDLNLRFLTSKASRLNQTFSRTDKIGGPLGNRTPITDLQGQCNPIILAAHKYWYPVLVTIQLQPPYQDGTSPFGLLGNDLLIFKCIPASNYYFFLCIRSDTFMRMCPIRRPY